MIYLDSSALLKLLFQEAESQVLERWLSDRPGTPLASSEVAKIEVVRASRRLDVDQVSAARAMLRQIDLIPLSVTVMDEAADVGEPLLRTLDAIHLASALSVKAELSAFVGYDRRLNEAAVRAGLALIVPGFG